MGEPKKPSSKYVDPKYDVSPELRAWLETTSYPPDQAGPPDGPPPELPDDPDDDE